MRQSMWSAVAAKGKVGPMLVGFQGKERYCMLIGGDFVEVDLLTRQTGAKFCSLDEAEAARYCTGFDY